MLERTIRHRRAIHTRNLQPLIHTCPRARRLYRQLASRGHMPNRRTLLEWRETSTATKEMLEAFRAKCQAESTSAQEALTRLIAYFIEKGLPR